MFRNTYQKGFLSIFYSIGTEPLAIWRKRICNGHIKRITDDDIESIVFEMMGANVATTYIKTPPQAPLKSLAIKLPFLIIIMKNLKKYFSFEVQILDDRNMWRRFRISNYQTTTRVKPFCTYMPIGLAPGWNQIQMNLADFTRRAYGTNYVETVAVQIHANLRLRRVYFSDHLYKEDEKPPEYRLMNPLEKKPEKPPKRITYTRKTQPTDKTIARPTTPQEQPSAESPPAPSAPPAEDGKEQTEKAPEAEAPAAEAPAAEAPAADAPAADAPAVEAPAAEAPSTEAPTEPSAPEAEPPPPEPVPAPAEEHGPPAAEATG